MLRLLPSCFVATRPLPGACGKLPSRTFPVILTQVPLCWDVSISSATKLTNLRRKREESNSSSRISSPMVSLVSSTPILSAPKRLYGASSWSKTSPDSGFTYPGTNGNNFHPAPAGCCSVAHTSGTPLELDCTRQSDEVLELTRTC